MRSGPLFVHLGSVLGTPGLSWTALHPEIFELPTFSQGSILGIQHSQSVSIGKHTIEKVPIAIVGKAISQCKGLGNARRITLPMELIGKRGFPKGTLLGTEANQSPNRHCWEINSPMGKSWECEADRFSNEFYWE